MKNIFKTLSAAALVTMLGANVYAADSLDSLLEEVKANRLAEKKIDSKREAEFKSARADKQALLRKAQRELRDETARGDRLKKAFADNDVRITEKVAELDAATGTLGEMFGVVRQASADAFGMIATSIVSAEFPGRSEFLNEMSKDTKGLPSIDELEELWFALQTEMTESGKVKRFERNVVLLDGGTEDQNVVRIGTFALVSDQGYLEFKDGQVQPLGRQPSTEKPTATNFAAATSGLEGVFVDPTQGTILGLLKQRATWLERYHAGDIVGYVITAMLAVGLLIGIYKIITLVSVSGKIRSQLNNVDSPSESNPLGRILKVYQDNKGSDAENLELKLDEAILKELPSIESGINIIKIFAAIAPLMGLLGTVLGMIETFQQITLFGTGDPKIMAGSISMALVTTAQGIIAALPLILMHSIVAGRSKSIVHVLDEQTAGIVAAHAETEKA